MKKITLLAILITFLSSCCIVQYKIPYYKVVFGKGGGISGIYDEYFIDTKGDLYKKDASTAAYSLIKSLPQKQIKEVYREIKKNDLYKVAFNNPYSYSYFIEIFDNDKSNRIVWGNANNPPPAEVTTVYQKLMELTMSTPAKSNDIDNTNKKK